MRPDHHRWHQIDDLFARALDHPASGREEFVRRSAGNDAELAGAVLALVDAERHSRGLYESPGAAVSEGLISGLAAGGTAPTRIDRYVLVREIGRGGMGTVYLAEHEGDGFRQKVALKILRRGVDTDDVLRRFVNERRILASLAHPNVARLHDGGATPDGRPYLVMEFVEGEPITGYCERHQLPMRQRLELVLQVADAVRAAHAALIVHRDLKPSNILVTVDGRVKLLDFGIAKLLDGEPEADHTRPGVFVLTPDHASPEQLRGEPVTTATDVYQLGVLLFRLLTGVSYRVRADAHEIPRASAVAPPQLRRALAGDVDRIVGKALQAEPERRYASVEELSRDIRRYLDGRTISARPETLAYLARTWLRRHPWVAPVAFVLAAFVTVYGATLIRHTRALERERNEATFQAERAQEVQRFLADLFGSANPYAPADPERGKQITVAEALDLGVERLRTSLTDRPAVRAAILSAISQTYQDLGVFDRALPLREEARALQASLYGAASREVRDSLGALAVLRAARGELDAAGALHEQRLALAAAAAPPDVAEIASARIRFGRYLMTVSRAGDAEAQFEAVMELAGGGQVSPADLGEATRSLADAQRMLGRLAASEESARRAIELIDATAGEHSIAGALARGSLAQTLGELARFDDADALFQAVIDRLERLHGPNHFDRLTTMSNLSVLRLSAGNVAGAEVLLREIVEIGRRIYGERHPTVANYLQNHATALVRLGHLEEARVTYERVADIYREALDPGNHLRALPLLSLSGIHLAQERPARAEALAREALGILREALPAGHFITGVAECRVAQSLVALQKPADAGPLYASSIEALTATTSVPAYRRECLSAAAAFYQTQGNTDEADRLRLALERQGS